MFEQPNAKRVRREDLHSATVSPRSTPDAKIEELLRSRVQDEFIFTTAASDIADPSATKESDNEDEEAELRLFATPSSNALKVQKIRLSSPGAGDENPGFIIKKPRSYYFADEPTSDEETRLQAAAITGDAIMELSQQPWPGCALPWKVHTTTPAGLKKEVLIGHPPTLVTVEDSMQKHKRKSKKTRISIRKKLQATKHKREELAKLAKERQEADREKRTRRNREKKIKKKAKAQAKKLDGVEGTAEAKAEDSSGDD
ncbi:hypothetical protein GQ44DRAFT_624449 [Phaeosphaeriaceae sp. PMI808]|nr:hypothetical protein GQ44DRAFT_624449 [Phaeosphaeriaceae sp. PMI808]